MTYNPLLSTDARVGQFLRGLAECKQMMSAVTKSVRDARHAGKSQEPRPGTPYSQTARLCRPANINHDKHVLCDAAGVCTCESLCFDV